MRWRRDLGYSPHGTVALRVFSQGRRLDGSRDARHLSEVSTMKQVGRQQDAPASDLDRVQAQHQELDLRLKELRRRPYLTPLEQREVSELKKYKLKAKDEIASLRGR
jgi:uncharacterized protein YdcH (DUF465 family)